MPALRPKKNQDVRSVSGICLFIRMDISVFFVSIERRSPLRV